jgi:hypothetical protein
MTSATPRRRRLLTAALLAGALVLTSAAAENSRHSEVQALLAAFEANHRPTADMLDAAWHVDLLGRQLALDAAPRLAFTERVTWQGSQGLSLELDLSATVTLYRSNAVRLAALQEQRERLVGADAAFAARDALHQFQNRLLALTLLRQLEEQLAGASTRAAGSGWRAPHDLEQALQLHPQERDLLLLGRSIADLHAQVALEIATLEAAVATALGSTEGAPHLPPFDELLALLAPATGHAAECLVHSPLLAQLSLHHELVELEHEAQAAPDVRLELFGSGMYRNGELNGAVGLELRVPLPSTSPLAGQLALAADPGKLEQTLRLTWPPPAAMTRPQRAAERSRDQADERTALEAEILELFRSLDAARAAVSGAELQLYWLVTDAHRPGRWEPAASQPLDLPTVRSLSLTPAPDPFADLQRVRYLSELAFARLAYAEQLLSVALVCAPGA